MVRTVSDIEASVERAREGGDVELYESYLREKRMSEGQAMTPELLEARIDARVKEINESLKRLEAFLGLSNPQEEEKKEPPALDLLWPFRRFFHCLKRRRAAAAGLPTES